MSEIAESSAGRLAGLEHRLKGPDRVKEKVAERLDVYPQADVAGVVASIPDAIRYTLQYERSDYVDGVRTDIERLKDQGFELIRLRNVWDHPEYKGINSRWRDETGQLFEVQFHTDVSFEAKQLTHEAYERLRSLATSGEEAADMRDFQRKVSAMIPIPDGVDRISDYP